MPTRKRTPAARSPKPDAFGFSRLVLENVRCFALAEAPLDAPVTVIIGQNGSGKTTLAEAIASLAYGEHEGHDDLPLRDGAAHGSIALLGAGPTPVARWTATERSRLLSGHIFAYGQYRALRAPVRRGGDPALLGPEARRAELRPLPDNLADASRRSTTATLFRFDEHLFRDLAAYAALLHDAGAHNPAAGAAWKRFEAWLVGLDQRVEGVEIAENEGRRRAVFRRLGLRLPITDLSDGYRAVLAVVLDLVLRYTTIFAALDDPLAGEATVVIDEVDLNLHPRWQREIIRQLRGLFPHTRFVLTTHSAAVVQAAIDEHHAVLVLKEQAEGTTVVRLAPGTLAPLDGADIDAVLVQVFGVPSRYSPTWEEREKEAARLGDKLERGTATDEERQRLFGLLDELQGLLAREDERTRSGPLMSAIAKTQIGLLRRLDGGAR